MSDPRPLYDPLDQLSNEQLKKLEQKKDTREKMSIDSITRKVPKSPAQIQWEQMDLVYNSVMKLLKKGNK